MKINVYVQYSTEGYLLVNCWKNLEKENENYKNENQSPWEGRVSVSVLPGSQLPVLLTTVLLLYCFQAALALGFSTTAGGFTQSTRQAGQLDLLHVFYSFILGILQQVSLSLQTGRNSKEDSLGPGSLIRGMLYILSALSKWGNRPRPANSPFQGLLRVFAWFIKGLQFQDPNLTLLNWFCGCWQSLEIPMMGNPLFMHWGQLILPSRCSETSYIAAISTHPDLAFLGSGENKERCLSLKNWKLNQPSVYQSL